MKKIATSFAALLTAGLLASGCAGQAVQAGQAAAPAEAAAPFTAAAAAEGRAVYQQVAADVWGTADERVAAEKAINDNFQSAMAACMEDAGQPYVKGPAPRTTSGNLAPDGLDVLAELGNDGFGIAPRVRYDAEIAEADSKDPTWAKLTEAQREAQGAAMGNCATKVGTPADVVPANKLELEKELVMMFRGVQAQPAVKSAMSGYSACMATEAGIKAANYGESFEAARAKFPLGNTNVWSKLSTDPKWAEAVAFEKRIAAADTTCRQPVQDQAMALALPQLSSFAAKQATKLTAADAGWAKIAS
jgi:hypothetical protein